MVADQRVRGLGVEHSIRIGGVSKAALLEELERGGVSLNPLAHALFDDARFDTSGEAQSMRCVALSVADLGLAQGGTWPLIVRHAAALGLSLCPVETGPHLRMQWRDQAEGAIGQPATRGKAPFGSLTVASAALCDDSAVPKGFYLRRIEGVLWLRGYQSDDEHVWSADDCLLFQAVV
ncbi:helicase [Chromobacterium paludis]|uniref:Helicase n=1 Tax=Chromobacterium paludis TaxID=2605945 RepID=A0A5C1DK30_9NEIS|nr:helicase [Chromobacterium paludis]QEL56960.1 helicase [Chromobacterium paludis]